MNDESNIEDVEQSETNEERYSETSLTAEPPETLEEAGFEGFGIGDADTAEGEARRAEEAHFEEVDDTDNLGEAYLEAGRLKEGIRELAEWVEDLPALPTEEEAEMGELYRVPTEGQFEGCELLEEGDSDLIGFITEGDRRDEATDEEVRQAVLEFEGGEN